MRDSIDIRDIRSIVSVEFVNREIANGSERYVVFVL